MDVSSQNSPCLVVMDVIGHLFDSYLVDLEIVTQVPFDAEVKMLEKKEIGKWKGMDALQRDGCKMLQSWRMACLENTCITLYWLVVWICFQFFHRLGRIIPTV